MSIRWASVTLVVILSCTSAAAQESAAPEPCLAFPPPPAVESLPGETEFRLIVKLREGRAVAVELFVVKGYQERSANLSAISALESHLRDQVRCPGIRELRYRVAMKPGESRLLELSHTFE